MKTKNFVPAFCCAMLLAAALACTPRLYFRQDVYSQTQSLKTRTLNTMEMATDNYSSHADEVQALQGDMQKLYNEEKARAKNDLTVKQWDVMLDSNAHLWGGFVKRWHTESTLGSSYIREKKTQVASAFEQILQLENAKPKQ